MKTDGKRSGKKVGVLIGAAVLLIALGAFFSNGLQIVFNLPDGVTETLECPAVYEAPAVTASLRGKWLFRDGYGVPVTAEGAVDGSTPGTYSLVWKASFLWFRGEVRREVVCADTTPR